jgi:Zn-dependent protease
MTFGLRIVALILMLLTSIGVYGTLDALHARGGTLTSIVIVIMLGFVAILFHELAHAAAAHLAGARVHAIIAFPFRLRFRPRRLELIKRGAHHRGDLGGYVSYSLDRIDARRKHAIIAAAGPLANLALAVLAGTMAPLFDHPGAPPLPIILFAFAMLSGGLGLANLIPYDGSDGDHILNLWRRRAGS